VGSTCAVLYRAGNFPVCSARSTNLEIRQQQSCRQFTLRTVTMIQDANSAFRQINPRLLRNCYRRCSTADVSPPYAATLARPVYESSSFWTSAEAYETSHNVASLAPVSLMLVIMRARRWWAGWVEGRGWEWVTDMSTTTSHAACAPTSSFHSFCRDLN